MPAHPSLRALPPVSEPPGQPESLGDRISLWPWGWFIARRRRDLDVAQSAAAKQAGIPQSTASVIERGGPASLRSTAAYAEALGLAVAIVDPAVCIPGPTPDRADGVDMTATFPHTLLVEYTGSPADRCLDAAFESHAQLAGILADLGAGRHGEAVHRLAELGETVAQATRLARIAAEAPS